MECFRFLPKEIEEIIVEYKTQIEKHDEYERNIYIERINYIYESGPGNFSHFRHISKKFYKLSPHKECTSKFPALCLT